MMLALRRTPAASANWLDKLACWAIKARLVSSYCHGGIVVGNTLYHTTANSGLCRSSFDPVKWDLFDLGPAQDAAALALFDKHQGAAYDWISLLAFVLPWRFSDARRFYCFEWALLCMTGVYPQGRVTPEALLLSAVPATPENPVFS